MFRFVFFSASLSSSGKKPYFESDHFTGGGSLYADLGHFGRKPIQSAWLHLVFLASY
ncbi:MAG: KUP/HAK/KT family potassium transporter [Hyphomicrobium sp.]|nr:KUP/HAK/KT family potassium transporter [Hyphomicrobium sp.]